MPRDSVFVDTSGWANFVAESESHHARAVALVRDFRGRNTRIVTTNWVLLELVALLTARKWFSRPQVIGILNTIRAAEWVEVVFIDPALEERAYALLTERTDKLWSLCDCASFVLMGDEGIAGGLTTDHHFEQAGFVRLLA